MDEPDSISDTNVRAGVEFPLVRALQRVLDGQSPDVAESPMATLALQLASLIDQGIRVPECAREFRQCIAELKAMTAGTWRGDVLDQLQAKREQRLSG